MMPFSSSALCELTLAQAVNLLREREISALELIESTLDRIDQIQPTFQPFTAVFGDQALESARQVDALKRDRPPLAGIPIALKDLYDVAGERTGGGSRSREGHIAAADAEVTRRLRAAGAIIIGKTVTHEFAFGVTSPPARCAWDASRTPGGSSGGSGCAVAIGACSAALGTDTGCSVRLPASLNGIVGFKPTYGRVSRTGVIPLSWSCDHAGPLTKTVEDCAHLLGIIAGHDPADLGSAREPVPDFSDGLDAGLDGLRIGVPTNYFFDAVQPGVGQAVRSAIEVLGREGAELVEVEIPLVEFSVPIVMVLALVEGAAVHRRAMRAKADRYGEEVRSLLEVGHLISGADYIDALRARMPIRESLCEAFETNSLDLLATPSAPMTALPAGQDTYSHDGEPEQPVLNHYARFAAPFNLSGQPALSVPCGFDDNGLPAGLQLVGKPFDERLVLQAGRAYEQATEWHELHPRIGQERDTTKEKPTAGSGTPTVGDQLYRTTTA